MKIYPSPGPQPRALFSRSQLLMRSVSTLAITLCGIAVVVPVEAKADTITNSTSIVGKTPSQPPGDTTQTNGTNGSPGGVAVNVTGSTTYINTSSGSITGGTGGKGATAKYSGAGGNGGVGVAVTGSGNVINNSGAIKGGTGGSAGNTSIEFGAAGDGAAAVTIAGTGNKLVNAGTLKGGAGGGGLVDKYNDYGNSVTVTGSNNTVELDVGGSFSNNVVSTGTANTFALGGAGNGTFNFGSTSSKVTGFTDLDVTGTANWSILGTNTTTGSVTIDNGATLTLGTGGTSGLIAAGQAIHDNGTLAVNHSDAVTLAQLIDGTGGLSQIGAGKTTVTAADTYTGATTITQGTLALSGAGDISASSGVHDNSIFDVSAATSAAPAIAALDGSGQVVLGGKTLTLTNANSTFGNIFSGVASGMGGLTVANGTEVLTGNNTYTGATTIGNGALLQLGSGGASGAIGASSAIHNSGVLYVNRSDAVTLGQVIDGTGSLTQAGMGTTALTSINTYTGATNISGGKLALSGAGSIAPSAGVHNAGALDISGSTNPTSSVAALDGAGNIVLGGNTLNLTNANTTFGNVFSGVASGTGGLNISGGNEVLSGANTYTGATTVASGAGLNLSGSVAGDVASSARKSHRRVVHRVRL